MTHDPDQEHTVGAEPPTGQGTEWEVLAGPGGAERERPPGGGVRGVWQRRSARARAVTAATAVAVLALGGTVAYATTSSPAAGNGALPAASGTASASPSPGESGDGHSHGPWSGLGVIGVHGESTVKDRDSGTWVIRVWQRGTVEKVAGDQVTVKSEDGAAWTWTVGSDVKVFPDEGSGADAVKKGDTAFLIGTRAHGTRTAQHVLAGTWEKKVPDWLGRHPGHKFRDREAPTPSGSGATA
ncbi:hypothetical protein [Streptomyces sp. NPDC050287]|uniref:hypothetical protein n=1 Tax=Streptomyces sp. NPDC050287 TaxID=3365608 RepID=UPI00378DE4FB